MIRISSTLWSCVYSIVRDSTNFSNDLLAPGFVRHWETARWAWTCVELFVTLYSAMEVARNSSWDLPRRSVVESGCTWDQIRILFLCSSAFCTFSLVTMSFIKFLFLILLHGLIKIAEVVKIQWQNIIWQHLTFVANLFDVNVRISSICIPWWKSDSRTCI